MASSTVLLTFTQRMSFIRISKASVDLLWFLYAIPLTKRSYDNVLVDVHEQLIICDFGLSCMLSYSQTILVSTPYETIKGSVRWMAYELLELEFVGSAVKTEFVTRKRH